MNHRRAKDESLRLFGSEHGARIAATNFLSSHFELWPEVQTLSLDSESTYSLDAVTYCHSTGFILGWEFKKSHLFMAEFSNALRQAINYRDAKIMDPRIPKLMHRQVHGCIVFPHWDGLHDDGTRAYAGEAAGMRHLAQHFRVGTLDLRPDLISGAILVGPGPIWSSSSGWTKNAEGVLRGFRRRGSQKQRDAAARYWDEFFDSGPNPDFPTIEEIRADFR